MARQVALTRAERNIAWCEHYIRIPEGKFVGQPLRMAEFMKEDFRAIFDNPHGTRRAIISRGRKNAKTVETAMLMLLYLCGPEAAPNSQLYSTARSREQAAILFSLAAKMCRMNPELMEHVQIKDSAKEIHCGEVGSRYKALSADASTALGLSPRFVAHDELGQVRGPRDSLYEALETATAAQDNPISIIISTQAPNEQDLLSLLIEDARSGADPRTVLRLHTAPDELETFSDEAIRAANPAFDVFMNKSEVLAMAAAASRMPSRAAEYENLVLNRRVEAISPFVTRVAWELNGDDPDHDVFLEEPSFVGIDLSGKVDLTAMVQVAWRDRWHVRAWFWTPADTLRDRAARDRAPYDTWAQAGLIRALPGQSLDYEMLAQEIGEALEGCDVQAVGFDRWRFDLLKKELDEIDVNLPLVPFGQGFKDMSPALETLETALLNGQIAHGNHPVLTMCMFNARVQSDAAGNRKLDKAKATGRIDGAIALAMAMGVTSMPESDSLDDFLASPALMSSR